MQIYTYPSKEDRIYRWSAKEKVEYHKITAKVTFI